MAIDGTVAAYKAGLVSQADYQLRINAMLSFLENIQLDSNNLPFYSYKWDSGAPAWTGGMDAADTGRTLNALGFLRRSDSSYASRIDSLLLGRLKPWIDAEANWANAASFQVYDRDALLGLTYFRYLNSQYDRTNWLNSFYNAWTSATNRISDIYGNSMPKVGANLGPVSYELLETGEDYSRTVQYASDMKQWAQRRYQATGKFGAWGSEFHVKLLDGSTPFAWEWYVVNVPNVGYATWQAKDSDGVWFSEGNLGSTTSSVDAAYALHAVITSDTWVNSMFLRFTQSDLTTSTGFCNGLFEATNNVEAAVSVAHNAMVLLASVYQAPLNSQVLFSSRTTDGKSNVGSITIAGQSHVLPFTSSASDLQIIATPPPNYQFYYWDTSGGVNTANCFAASTSAGITAPGSMTAVFTPSASAPTVSGSYFHPAKEFWFSRYDMLNAQWDAIHLLNVATANATVHIAIGTAISDTLTLGAGQATYKTYSGYVGGPVHITSNQAIWATQRIIGWTAMQEIYPMPSDMSSTDIMFTWYDLVGASSDDVYVINPSASQTANVTLYVAGVLRGRIIISPGSAQMTNFPGVIGGPLRIISNTPVFASQRVIGYGDFAEIIGLPSWYTFTETWFNWYDMQRASWDAIHMVNPGTATANVKIYIAGVLRATLTVSGGATDYRTFSGLVGGPVRVVSDQPIWVTQRIVGWNGWKEVFGVPTTLAKAQWYMTWYDMQNAQWDAIHVINPGATNATVRVYVGGVLRSTLTVTPGQAAYVTYPGLMAGPVQIVSTVPVVSSQRVLGWDSFEETVGASLT